MFNRNIFKVQTREKKKKTSKTQRCGSDERTEANKETVDH